MIKKIFKLSIIIFAILTSCSRNEIDLKQYQNYSEKFAKKTIAYPDKSFEISIPIDWKWHVENYQDIDEIILGIDAVSKPDKDNFINIISIQKVQGSSKTKNLKDEYYAILKKQEDMTSLKILESGKSTFLKQESYYFHARSNSGKYGELELFTYIIKNNSDNNFYYLTASASRTDNLRIEMSKMIQCLRTFTIIK